MHVEHVARCACGDTAVTLVTVMVGARCTGGVYTGVYTAGVPELARILEKTEKSAQIPRVFLKSREKCQKSRKCQIPDENVRIRTRTSESEDQNLRTRIRAESEA